MKFIDPFTCGHRVFQYDSPINFGFICNLFLDKRVECPTGLSEIPPNECPLAKFVNKQEYDNDTKSN